MATPRQELQPRGGVAAGDGHFSFFSSSTYANIPPSSTYAPHTTINGSRSSFIGVVSVAGLIFFALLGAGWFLVRRRRNSKRRRAASGAEGGHAGGAGRWNRLDEDAWELPGTANASRADLNPDGGEARYQSAPGYSPDLRLADNYSQSGFAFSSEFKDDPNGKESAKH